MAALDAEQQQVAARLGELTGESADQVVARVGADALPGPKFKLSPRIPQLLATEFADAGIRDGMPYLALPNGRVFYGLPSAGSHVRQHRLLRGLLDDRIPEECFVCALDVVYRYVADRTVPVALLPGSGGVIVEVGAYLGHKAMRMMDASIRTTGHYVGIEVMPENCEIMARNFAENGFTNTVIVPEGVWNEPGRIEVMGKGRQRHSLVDIDSRRISDPTGYTAPVNPLDDILARSLPEGAVVDFMYMSINGAELEALDGLREWAERVGAMYIAAGYERDGEPTTERARRKVADLGFELRDNPSEPRSIIAVRAVG